VTTRPHPLEAHLGERYGVRLAGIAALDTGVFKVNLADGPAWVARVFDAGTPQDAVEGNAAMLRALERRGFPAERCAHAEPVSRMGSQTVLVTGFVEAGPPLTGGRPVAILGSLLGGLHAVPGDGMRPARLWSLGFMLWALGFRSMKLVDVAVSRYRRHVTLTPEELERLPGAITGRPLMLACWSVCHGRRELAEAVAEAERNAAFAEQVAGAARRAFAASD
jgi:hypothetical protein